MPLVKLTAHYTGEPLYLNPDHVVTVYSKNGTTIVVTSSTAETVLYVAESLEEAVSRLNEKAGGAEVSGSMSLESSNSNLRQ